jgi:hypothetical protein
MRRARVESHGPFAWSPPRTMPSSCCCGLDGGEYGRPRRFAFLQIELSEECAYYAQAFLFAGYLGAWGEYAEGGVGSDLLDGSFGRLGGPALLGRLRFGEVEAGDLEAVEEQAGAAGVDVVGGDAAEDLADGGLDGGAVFRQGQVECGAAASALARVGDRLAGVVVVVAELFSAQTWASAAVSVGEDVAALVLFRCFDSLLHVFPPHGCFSVQSLRRKGDESGLEDQRVSLLASQLAGTVRPYLLFLRSCC